MPKKLFDIRIEVLKETSGEFRARTIIGNNGILYERTEKHLADALCDMLCDVDVSGGFQMAIIDPSVTYHFLKDWYLNVNLSAIPKAVPTSKPATKPSAPTSTPKPSLRTGPSDRTNVARKRHHELRQVPLGQCEIQCIVHDNFAGKKCRSFCPEKK